MTSSTTPSPGALKLEILPHRGALGQRAGAAAAERIRALAAEHEHLAVIFATGESQLATLHTLAASPDIPWGRITGFHMDEYVGISPLHPASFQHYLRQNLVDHVAFKSFHFVDGSETKAAETCAEYAALLRARAPRLCLLGIGENGHLAFNDPAEADFNDPADAKVVQLDAVCRQQQVNEGWFASLGEVPSRAITLTIPALMRVPELILSVPGPRKAEIALRTLTEKESTACPATILRRHPHATLYLDSESAARLPDHLR